MWCWHREAREGYVSVLAQRAVSEDPHWGNDASRRVEGGVGEMARAVETHPSCFPMKERGGRVGRVVKRTRVSVAIVAAALIGVGCALVMPQEDPSFKQATAGELTALLRQREAAIHSMKGLFSAKVRGGMIPIASRIEGTVHYRRPNALRLRGFTSVGSELFEFVQADDLYKLKLPTMGRVLTGRQSDMADMGKLARPFQLSVWAIGGVLGTGAITHGETVKLAEEGDRYRLDVYAAADWTASDRSPVRRVWFDRRTLLVVQEDRLSLNGEVDATIQYEDFRVLDDPAGRPIPAKGARVPQLLRPFKIFLEDGHGQGSVQVIFHEMVPNQTVKAEELGQVS